MNKKEFKRECNNIVGDAEAILQKPVLTRSQEKMAKILSLLPEIPNFKDKKLDEQPDTTGMPELESEESAEQKGIGIKILTPNQVLSRLPISLSQLKAENSSEKPKNEIRQLLHSLYRSKINQNNL